MAKAYTLEEALKMDEERFWSKVDKTRRPDGCWIWMGTRTKHGRGHYAPGMFQAKHVRTGRSIEQAHVYAWVLTHGARPLGHGLERGSRGIILRHACGNGHIGCVNPHHLRVGTQHDNNRETREAGRMPDQKIKRIQAQLQRLLAEIEGQA